MNVPVPCTCKALDGAEHQRWCDKRLFAGARMENQRDSASDELWDGVTAGVPKIEVTKRLFDENKRLREENERLRYANEAMAHDAVEDARKAIGEDIANEGRDPETGLYQSPEATSDVLESPAFFHFKEPITLTPGMYLCFFDEKTGVADLRRMGEGTDADEPLIATCKEGAKS